MGYWLEGSLSIDITLACTSDFIVVGIIFGATSVCVCNIYVHVWIRLCV